MPELLWLNGEIVPMAEARISVEDRGFQFADGVYEVIRIYNGKPFALMEHLQRLRNSTEGIDLEMPVEISGLAQEIRKFIEHAAIAEGMVYLQLTRGVAERNHIFPTVGPTLLFYVRPLPPVAAPGAGAGVKLMTAADERWKRCWIKSIALLPNVLAKNKAIVAGADEAVFIENGMVTECSVSNIFGVIDGKLITHPPGSKVLPGITRAMLLELAREMGLKSEERAMTEQEAAGAEEVFITSTTREVSWVGEWDGRKVGEGRCGGITKKLHEAIVARVKRDCGG